VDPFFISQHVHTTPFAVSKAVTMMNLLLDNTSAQFPLNVALIFQNRSYTYADLSRLTQCLATSLLQRGISPGDRAAFPLPNCLEIVLCYPAVSKRRALPARSPDRHLQLMLMGSRRTATEDEVPASSVFPFTRRFPALSAFLCIRLHYFRHVNFFRETQQYLGGADTNHVAFVTNNLVIASSIVEIAEVVDSYDIFP